MRKPTMAAALAVVALTAAACGSGGERDGTGGAAAPAGGGGEESPAAGGGGSADCADVSLEATEVGVSEDTITVEMIGDTGAASIPGMANGAVEAVEDWADLVNEQGGLACRQVEVRTYDSKINPDEARNGYVDACENAFAAVGTTALAVADVTPMAECPDTDGETTGLPEVPGLTISPIHTCNPTTWGAYGSGQPCPPATGEREVVVPSATGDFLSEQVGEDAHGLYLVPTTNALSVEAVMAPIEYLQQERGLTADVEAGARGSDPQSVYTPYVTDMRDAGSTFGYGATTWPSYLLLQQEAATQGVDSLDTWYCVGACYDAAYAEAGGSAVAGTYVGISNLPYEEADVNEEVAEFTSRVEEVNTFAQGAWVASRLFQRAVEDVVAEQGPNGLTRANFLTAIQAVEDFDANGMIGRTTPSTKRPAECLVVVQVQDDGSFERVYPEERGTFACSGYETIAVDPTTAFGG